MKSVIVLSFLLSLMILVPACNDGGSTAPNVTPRQEVGSLALLFSNPPSDITQVVATVSRQGFEARTVTLMIHDSTQSASGSFADVPVGMWHLRVQAFDQDSVVRFAGETDVDVHPGQIAQVTLQLVPTSGGIQITVTWGQPPLPANGLMAYYPLNGNADDVSGNGNTGVVSGAVPTANRHGTPNSALWFDGVNDNITIPSSPSLHPIDQMTIAFWIRVDRMQNNYLSVLTKSNPANPLSSREYRVDLKFGGPVYYYFQVHSAGDGYEQHTVFSNNLSGHEWMFFTAVIDRQNHVMKTYVNGVLNVETDDSYSSFNTNDDPLMIAMESETWPDHSPFLGALDEIRLYNRALTPPEIQALYTAP